MKRMLDLIGAGTVLIFSVPLLIALAPVLWLLQGRPVILRQRRAGEGSRPFALYKLRTMREGNEADDIRLTRLGRVLRALSLDELPQLWNVIRGDMTIVGPRPLPLEYLGRYSRRQSRRHEVRPGITGLAQVTGRNLLSWEERFALDVWYVDHRSLRLDLWILWRTLVVVFRREGISARGQATMTEFFASSSPALAVKTRTTGAGARTVGPLRSGQSPIPQ